MSTLKTLFGTSALGLIAVAGFYGTPVQAQATVSFSTTAAVKASDQSNLIGAVINGDNVNGGTGTDTYIANDQPAVGQLFTTGSNALGYTLTALTLQQVGYSTFWDTSTVASNPFTVQVIKTNGPVPADSTGANAFFPGVSLHSETAAVTGLEANNFGKGGNANGTGNFITFTFAAPVALAANTQYGFDVGTKAVFFQTNGTKADNYTGGQAYISGGNGVPGTGAYAIGGDHVFVASLSAVPSVPEASTTASFGLLLALGLGGFAVARRKSVKNVG